MPSKGTPVRSIRVPDELWEAGEAKAAGEDTTLRAVILRAIAEYVMPPVPHARKARTSRGV